MPIPTLDVGYRNGVARRTARTLMPKEVVYLL